MTISTGSTTTSSITTTGTASREFVSNRNPERIGCPISGGIIARCGCRRYNSVVPLGLKRYQYEGEDHFLTFSCYGREPYLGPPHAKDRFLLSLELTRQSYGFEVLGYVVMPEHVHLLVSEPSHQEGSLATAIQALKISVSRRLTERPFWQRRYYGFNVFTHNKRIEKLR